MNALSTIVRTMLFRTFALLVSAFLIIPSGMHGQEYTIKFATVAPDGSTWMNVMRELDAAVRKESGGRLGFRVYPGGVQGDEGTVLRKIRIGQLHAGGFTGVGMGEIAPKVRILDTPFLVRTYDEIDHVYHEFDAELREAFQEGGYVLLGWAEVGFVHVFTSTAVKTMDDLSAIKMWTWEGDPVARAAFGALNLNPIPLSITDVLTSLQTGLVDAFYTSPLAAVALQWFTRVKYMVDVPLADAAGAVLLSKRFYDRLPDDLKEILLRNSRAYMAQLTTLSRSDNEDAKETLKKQGITFLRVEDKDLGEFIEAGRRARRALVGTLYDEDFLNRVEQSVQKFRGSKNTSK